MQENNVIEITSSKEKEIPISDIRYREDLYPRIETSAATVQKYAEDLDILPPIEINQNNELIDGWHRWTAHKKKEKPFIRAIITETKSDAHFLELAIERNAVHGLQLSQDDKRNMARNIYHVTPEKDRQSKKKHLAKILSVSERTINNWLSRIDKDAKEARNKKIFEMWLSCYTQQEIADAVGLSQKEVNQQILYQTENLPEGIKPAANHQIDFTPPIYNVWKQQSKSGDISHFGNSEQTFVDNLLYLYTQPFDIVVDPFAGGGSTIDLCKKRFRRYWVSDRKPIVEREKEIRQHDLINGLPALPRWKDVRLVYLDPPYWKQAEGKYSNHDNDLSNMPLDRFTDSLAEIINEFAKKLKNGTPSYIALILQPTQWRAPNRQFTDHVSDMIRLIKLPIDMRIQAPYESQQCTAQMVEWAKENKKILVLSREIVIWRVE